MATFTDKHGREYTLAIDRDAYWRVQRLTGIELCRLTRWQFVRMMSRPTLVIWSIVEPQCWAHGIDTREEFVRSLDVDAYLAMNRAFFEALHAQWPEQMAQFQPRSDGV